MTSKIISTFTAAVISMSITFAAPVGVIAVTNLTAVPEAQAGFYNTLKKNINHNVRKISGKNCPGGGWIKNGQGLCGKALDPNWMKGGRIGDPVRSNSHDHRKK